MLTRVKVLPLLHVLTVLSFVNVVNMFLYCKVSSC